MLDNLSIMLFFIGVVSILFYTPMVFARGIFTLSYGTLSSKEKVLCYIPVYNTIKAEVEYTGKFSKIAIATAMLLVSVLVRVICYFFFRNSTVILITVLFFLLSAVIYLISNMWLVFMVIADARIMPVWNTLLWAIVYPLGQYYIGTYLPVALKHAELEEETFK